MVHEKQFFRALGQRVKKLRTSRGYTQEDMIGLGFSARHWQQIEAGWLTDWTEGSIGGSVPAEAHADAADAYPKGTIGGHALARMERWNGVQSSALVEPFSELHHQCTA